MKNKICVIFTGGTIGSSESQKTVSLDSAVSTSLIRSYTSRYRSDIVFSESYPVQILSENIQRADLYAMISALRRVDTDVFDGVIITHGTDTLSFSANIFSQVFCDYPLPIVFVSSLYPLDDPRSNGIENFAAAVDFIREGLGGVYVAFKNQGSDFAEIHLASRICAAEQFSGNMHSVLETPFGICQNGIFKKIDNPLNPTIAEIKNRKCAPCSGKICDDVLVLRARPLLDFSVFDIEKLLPKAVVVELYHSGTICTVGDRTNFKFFSDRCKKLGIPLIIGPIYSSANVYSSADGAFDDAMIAYDMTFDMAAVKVILALGEGKPIEKALSENLFFEKIPRT